MGAVQTVLILTPMGGLMEIATLGKTTRAMVGNNAPSNLKQIIREDEMKTEVNYSKTYWSNAGKHEDFQAKLTLLIPAEGEVTNANLHPALELFRIASNCYYDLYNNELCNRGKDFHKVFGFDAFGVGEARYGRDDDGDQYDGSVELTTGHRRPGNQTGCLPSSDFWTLKKFPPNKHLKIRLHMLKS